MTFTPVCLIAAASWDSPAVVDVIAPPVACKTRQTKSHVMKMTEILLGRIHESLSSHE